MAFNLRHRSFLKEVDFEPGELRYLLLLAEALKLAKDTGTETAWLTGMEIALLVRKTAVRSAFEVAAHDQGACVAYVDPSGTRLGHKESVAEVASVLGRVYDGIAFRGARQSDVETLAEHAGVPVYNGHTDEWNPIQVLADFLTMHEVSQKPYDAISYLFVGDCRFNVGRSLLITGALMGSDVRLSGPAELLPPKHIVELAADIAATTGARVTITDDVAAVVSGVDFILAPYQVNADLLAKSGNDAVKFLHCDQAENRLHVTKAVLVATLT